MTDNQLTGMMGCSALSEGARRMAKRIGLESDFHYYLDHQEELVEQYDGRIIVIKEGRVLGVYDSQVDAIGKTVESGYELGTFLVQTVSEGSDAYTQTHHSRVMNI